MFTKKRLLIIAAIAFFVGLVLAMTGYSNIFPPDTHIILIALGVICFLLSAIVPGK